MKFLGTIWNRKVGEESGLVPVEVQAQRAPKETDVYETPPEEFAWIEKTFGPFDMDVCAEYATRKCETYFSPGRIDGLKADWSQSGRFAWMNPPYSDIAPWLQKARLEAAKGVRTTCLLPADSSTGWWHENIEFQPLVQVYRLPKRIRFILRGKKADSPNFASVIVVFLPRLLYPGVKPG